ncbi:DNA polymerase [Paludisphaera rhizosphaerae]|uniref:DNA polymerase n=1 Tax=Paludisphaera rhizosphaerae TaxID=2711216 RepID=UPI001F117986|nr:DNA polymerase [Paludisphaera rhizosphaerae]
MSDRSGIVPWGHASSGQGSASRRIHPDRLGEFVRLHRDREFILHDVAAGFWLVAEHLIVRNEADALNDWWSIADQGRLHDPALLDQLIKLAQTDDEPRPRSLAEIAAEYVGASRGSGLVDAAAASLRAYSVMQRLAIDLMGPYREQILRDAVETCGVLTETVQVKAAIALAAASRNGLRLDVARLEAAKSRLRDSVARSVETIRALPGCDRLFRTTPSGRFLGTTSGTPNLDVVELRRVLIGVVDEVAADSGRSIAVPRTSSGDVSTSTKRWEAIAPSHPFVSAWAELGRASSLLRCAASLVGPVVRPNYTTLVRTGRTTASGPNIQALPRRGGLREAFVPSPGHVFLIVDYVCAELRTLAAVCEARFGSSRLAQVLRAGGDPHAHTAALFEGVEPREFLRLRSGSPRDRERFSVLRRRAKAINFGIPGGLGAEALAVYARTNFNVAMTAAEAGELRRRLIAEVYPELGAYLSDERGPQGGTSHAPRGIVTSSGRIRGVVNYTQARNTPFQGVAADAAKLALWHLIRDGHRVVAFIHDEFVVELPKSGVDHLAEARKIELILNRAMESATPGIPSACEFVLSRRWSKDARPVYSSDGRLLPWDDQVERRSETAAFRP